MCAQRILQFAQSDQSRRCPHSLSRVSLSAQCDLSSLSVHITKTHLFKYMEIFTTKKKGKKIRQKILIFFIFLLINDCGYPLELPRRGGSNEYPQSMFLSRNKKNNVYPCKPQFYYIKVGFKGVKII